LINTLMDAALSEAAVQRLNALTPALIDEMAADLGWKPLSRAEKKPAPAKTAAAPSSSTETAELTRRSSDSLPAKSNGNASKDSTGRLLAAAGLLDTKKEQTGTGRAAEPAAQDVPASVPDEPRDDAPSAYPEMSASDTGATGMLKLEDLDAQFAESAFGDDTGMFNVTDSIREKLKKAANKDG
jgi:hypothetical protein